MPSSRSSRSTTSSRRGEILKAQAEQERIKIQQQHDEKQKQAALEQLRLEQEQKQLRIEQEHTQKQLQLQQEYDAKHMAIQMKMVDEKLKEAKIHEEIEGSHRSRSSAPSERSEEEDPGKEPGDDLMETRSRVKGWKRDVDAHLKNGTLNTIPEEPLEDGTAAGRQGDAT